MANRKTGWDALKESYANSSDAKSREAYSREPDNAAPSSGWEALKRSYANSKPGPGYKAPTTSRSNTTPANRSNTTTTSNRNANNESYMDQALNKVKEQAAQQKYYIPEGYAGVSTGTGQSSGRGQTPRYTTPVYDNAGRNLYDNDYMSSNVDYSARSLYDNDYVPEDYAAYNKATEVKPQTFSMPREDRDKLINDYVEAAKAYENNTWDEAKYRPAIDAVEKAGGIEKLYNEQQADAANDRDYDRQLRDVNVDGMTFWERFGTSWGGFASGTAEQIGSSGLGIVASNMGSAAFSAADESSPASYRNALNKLATTWYYGIVNGADEPALEDNVRKVASYVGGDAYADAVIKKIRERADEDIRSGGEMGFSTDILDDVAFDDAVLGKNLVNTISESGIYDDIQGLQASSAEHLQQAKDYNNMQDLIGGNAADYIIEGGASTAQNMVDAGLAAMLGLSGGGVIAMAPFALRAFGGSYAEVIAQAKNLGEEISLDVLRRAAKTATLSSGIEVGTELIWGFAGAMSKVTGGGPLDDAMQERLAEAVSGFAKTEQGRKILSLIGEKALGGITEGLEEVIGDASEQILKTIGIMPGDPVEWEQLKKEMGHSFVTGALGGLMGEVSNIVATPMQQSQIGKQLKAGAITLADGTKLTVDDMVNLANSPGMEGTSLEKTYSELFKGVPRSSNSFSDRELGKLYAAYEETIGHSEEAIDRVEKIAEKVGAGEELTRADVNRITNNPNAARYLRSVVGEDLNLNGNITERKAAVEMALRTLASENNTVSNLYEGIVNLGAEDANTAELERQAQEIVGQRQLMPEAIAENYFANSTQQAVRDAAQRLGIDEAGQEALANVYMGPRQEAEASAQAYQRGLSGEQSNGATWQENAAYEMARQEHLKSLAQEEIRNDREETDGLRVRTGIQGNDGQSTGGQTERVEGASGSAELRESEAGYEGRGPVSGVYSQPVSAADFGIRGGSTKKNLRVIARNSNNKSAERARGIIEARGMKCVVFAGGALEVNGEQARGYYDPESNTIYVRADHRLFTADQIAMHEVMHDKIRKGEVSLKDARDYMVEKLGWKKFEQTMRNYYALYEKTGMTNDQVFEEAICDAAGEMNDFVYVGHFEDARTAAPFYAAAKEAGEQAGAEKNPLATDAGAKMSSDRDLIKRPGFTQKEIDKNSVTLQRMGPVATLTGKEFMANGKRLVDNITNYYDSIGNSVYNDLLGEVALTRTSAKDDIAHGTTRNKIVSYASLPAVIKSGVVIHVIDKGRGQERIVIAAPVMIGAEKYYVAAMLNRDPQSQRLYAHDVVAEKESNTVAGKHLNTNRVGSRQEGLFITDILRNALAVNENIDEAGKEYGDSGEYNSEAAGSFSRELDREKLRDLENGKTMRVYRSMQVIDGKLYPPMAAKVNGELVEPTALGEWYVSDERPNAINRVDDRGIGWFTLDKANGDSLEAAYNPYWHTSNLMINDQFTSAYKRDNLVTVECEIPVSELSSGYKAQYAKDPVGRTNWHKGPVAGKLAKSGNPRTVFLSRWVKVNRIVSDAEVARNISNYLAGTDIEVPVNTVTPGLRSELEKIGVPISKVSGKISAADTEKLNASINTGAYLPTSASDSGSLYNGTDFMYGIDKDGRKFSLDTMKQDIEEEKFQRDLKTVLKWDDDQIRLLVTSLNKLMEYIEPNKDILDLGGGFTKENRPYNPYKPNSDPLYKISLDYSTLCRKRLMTQYIIEKLQIRENRPMSGEEQIAIRDMLKEYRQREAGLQVACAMCYVEAARLKAPAQMNRFFDDPVPFVRNYFALKNKAYDRKVKEAQKKWIYDQTGKNQAKSKLSPALQAELNNYSAELRQKYDPAKDQADSARRAKEIAAMKNVTEIPRASYLSAQNLATLKEKDSLIWEAYTSHIRAATHSKGLETDVPYFYGDSRRKGGPSDKFIKNVNAENGMRFSSWSDFQFTHLLDQMMAIIDLSVRKAAMHGYTKFPEQVRIFGKTGAMFNMSGVSGGTGFNADGSLYFSPTESIDFEEAKKLRNEFPETAGLQCIGINEKHTRALLASEFIDYVIPYHVSGLNATLRKMAGIANWKDYTAVQEERVDKNVEFNPSIHDEKNWHKGPAFSEFFDKNWYTDPAYKGKGVEAMRKAADNYVRLCKERGLVPKFDEYRTGDGSENYWKLLIDRKMVNQKTGDLIQQKPVQPIFEFSDIEKEIDKYVKKTRAEQGIEDRAFDYIVEHLDQMPDRIEELKKGNVVADTIAKAETGEKVMREIERKANVLGNEMYAAAPKNVAAYRNSRDLDSAYMKAAESGDTETAAKLVKQAAEKAGYTVEGYHTTWQEKPFYVFDPSISGIGIDNLAWSWFAADREYTKNFGEGYTYDVFLKMENTLDVGNIEKGAVKTRLDSHGNLVEVKFTDAFEHICDVLGISPIDLWESVNDEYGGDDKYDAVGETQGGGLSDDGKFVTIPLYAFTRSGTFRSIVVEQGYDSVKAIEGTWKGGTTTYGIPNPEQIKSADPITYDDAGNIIPLSERFNPKNEDIRYSRELAPTFYSKLEREIENFKGDKIGASSAISYLKGKGVKDEDIKWSGITTFLEGKKSAGKAELLEYLRGNQLQIEEETLGEKSASRKRSKPTHWDAYTIPGGEGYKEILYKIPGSKYTNKAMQTHWKTTKGVVAHARVQDFYTDSGKILFVEEIQSDWHNAGEKQGYNVAPPSRYVVREMDNNGRKEYAIVDTKNNDKFLRWEDAEWKAKQYIDVVLNDGKPEIVPDAPFRNGTYIQYVLKDLLRKAAEGGYDYLAWTTGEMQENRWSRRYAKGYNIEYDQDIPSFLRKYGKQWGANLTQIVLDENGKEKARYKKEFEEVYELLSRLDPDLGYEDFATNIGSMYHPDFFEDEGVEDAFSEEQIRRINELSADLDNAYANGIIDEGTMTGETVADVPAIPITDDMRDSVLYEGQPMFSRDLSNTELYEANRQLQKDLTELRGKLKTRTEQYKYWKGQTKVTEGRQLRIEDVTKLAREIIKGQESSADAKAVAEKMKALGEYLLNSQDENVYDEARLKAYEVAHDILANAKTLNTKGGDDFYSDFRTALKNQAIYVAPSVREEVAPDGWNDFRKAQYGTVNMTADQNKGKSVDKVYHDLQATFGEWLLPEYITSEADQLNKILEIIETYRPVYENLNSYEMADAVEWTANEILTRIIGEEIRETNPTYADRMEKKLADQKAKAQTALKQVRQQRDRKVADLKAHYQQVAEDRRNRKIDSEMRSRLLKIAKRLTNKKLDRATRALLDQYIGEIDLVSKGILGRTIRDIEHLQDFYDAYKEKMGEDFVPDISIENRIKRLSKKHINDLTQEEVAELTTVLLNIETMLRTKDKLLESKIKGDVYAAGMQTIDDINNSNGDTGFLAKFIGAETATPERYIHRVTGYRENSPLYQAAKELSDGQRKMLDYQMRAEALFKKWTTDTKFIRRIAGKHAEEITVQGIVDGEKTNVVITPAMRMALYLHEKNDDNMHHISQGGVKIPDMKLYKKGDMENAYAKGQRVIFTRGMIKNIAAGMSAKEKAFADAVYRYYNGMSRNEINDVSEILKGFAIAGVENYFPIQTNNKFLAKTFDAIKRDGSIEGMGFLKERIDNASTPIMLYDLNTVLNRSISQHSKYVGLAIPVRNFEKLYNVTTFTDKGVDFKNNPLDPGWRYDTSIAETLTKNWGETAARYVEKMLADVENGTGLKDDTWGDLLAKARSKYAGAVLTTNASVAMKQAASYPTAAAVVGYGPLMRALADVSKIDLDKLAEYTPLLWYRSKGFSTTELGDIGKEGGHIPKALNWIQAIDVATTTKLAKAAMYYVNENNKNLTRGTDAWWKAVADVYNRIIEETQPNYTMMQRPQILRSDNALTRALNMFKTQPFQNFNILYDAFGNLAAKNREYKANATDENLQALRSARTNVARAVSSQAVSAFVFALMQFAWDAFRGKAKKYKDDDDEMTLASWLKGMGINVLSSAGGMIPFGSYALELGETMVDAIAKAFGGKAVFGQTFYGLSENAAESVNDMGNALINMVTKAAQALEGGEITESTIRGIVDSAADIAQFAGIPVNNVLNLFKAVARNVFIAKDGKYVGGYEALRVTTDPSKYKSDYYDLLKKAWQNDPAAYEEIRKMMINAAGDPFATSSKTAEENIDAKVKTWAKEKASQESFYNDAMSYIQSTDIWDKASAAKQKTAMDNLLKIASGTDEALAAKASGGKSVGLDETEYILFKLALSIADDGNGSYTNAETESAINMIPGLTNEEKSYLWEAQGKSAKSNPFNVTRGGNMPNQGLSQWARARNIAGVGGDVYRTGDGMFNGYGISQTGKQSEKRKQLESSTGADFYRTVYGYGQTDFHLDEDKTRAMDVIRDIANNRIADFTGSKSYAGKDAFDRFNDAIEYLSSVQYYYDMDEETKAFVDEIEHSLLNADEETREELNKLLRSLGF